MSDTVIMNDVEKVAQLLYDYVASAPFVTDFGRRAIALGVQPEEGGYWRGEMHGDCVTGMG